MFKKLIMTLAVASIALPAIAEENAIQDRNLDPIDQVNFMPTTGKDLAELLAGCAGSDCLAYTSGVISGIAAFTHIAEVSSPFCATGQVDTHELSRIVDQAIRSSEVLNEYPAPYVLLTAFAQSYPCDLEKAKADPENLSSVDTDILNEMIAQGGTMAVYGNLEAGEDRTIRVFHDPNCTHCAAFRSELALLGAGGEWKIEIYPVSVVSEDSAGYAAVALALKGEDPELAMSMYRDVPAGQADMANAIRRAEASGYTQTELFGLIARASGYAAVEKNTETFVKLGAKGTPSIIIGATLHNGALPASAIEELAASFESETEEVGVSLEVEVTDLVETVEDETSTVTE